MRGGSIWKLWCPNLGSVPRFFIEVKRPSNRPEKYLSFRAIRLDAFAANYMPNCQALAVHDADPKGLCQ